MSSDLRESDVELDALIETLTDRSLDPTFDILSARRRRDTLYTLSDVDNPITVDALVASLHHLEEKKDEHVRLELVHNHLPKLAAAEVVRYDRESGVVELTAEGERLEPVLSFTGRWDSFAE